MKEVNNKQNIQIARLEECQKSTEKKLDSMEEKVDLILTNHLPHIQETVSKLDANQKIFMWFMLCVMGALIGLFFK